MPRASLLVVLCLVMCSSSRAADWSQFRGPDGNGVSAEKDLPVSWGEQQNLVWKLKLPGQGSSSPVTLGDQLFLTCYRGYGTGDSDQKMEDLELLLLCIDRKSGEVHWEQGIDPTLPESERVRDHGYAAPTPVTDGEHLFVFFGKSGVMKFDLDGNLLWRSSVGSGTHGWGCGTSPVLFEDLVIVNASVESGSLVALKQSDGSEAWRASGMRASWNTPHLVALDGEASELVVSVKDKLLAFDPSNGKQLWECEGIHDYVCPSVVSKDGIVYAIGGRRSRALAVRAGGRGDVTDTHRLWEAQAGANVSSPVIVGEHLYWVSDRNRVAYCLRLKDGGIEFQQRFDGQPYASAVAGDDKVYIVTRYSGMFVLEAKPEFAQLAHNRFEDDSSFNASPAISGGRLFIRSNKFLYCIGR